MSHAFTIIPVRLQLINPKNDFKIMSGYRTKPNQWLHAFYQSIMSHIDSYTYLLRYPLLTRAD